MAPSKASRKGKKAWRRNIDTEDVVRAVEERTHEERQSTAVDTMDDTELFFVDKGRDDASAAAAKSGAARRRRREPKQLRCDVVAAAAAAKVRPVLRPPAPKRKAPGSKAAGAGPAAGAAAEGKVAAAALSSGAAAVRQPEGAKRKARGHKAGAAGVGDAAQVAGRKLEGASEDAALRDLWAEPLVRRDADEADFAEAAELAVKSQRGGVDAALLPHAPKRRRVVAAPKIAAVEVDGPGCSYNPDRAQHQEAVAAAVAAEVRKGIDRELAAQPPPRHVDWRPETDPLALLQVDAAAGDEEEDEGAAGAGGDGSDCQKGRAAAKKKTRVDRNRERRRREADAMAAARLALKAQRRDLQSLDALAAEADAEEDASAARRSRLAADRAEREKTEPPRLGKHRFQAAPVQVLLTEEITGSLRQLKPAAMLARERYSSLQKRGVIEPRVPVTKRGGRRRVVYTAGEKGERTREGHAELMAARKAAAAPLF